MSLSDSNDDLNSNWLDSLPGQRPASLLVNWVELLHRCLLFRGLDAQAIFDQAGLVSPGVCLLQERVSAQKVKALWERAAQLSGDEAFGLTAADVAFPVMFDSLSIAMSVSDNALSALQRFIRLRRMIDTDSINVLEEDIQGYKFSWSSVNNHESQVGAEAFIAAILTLCRWGAGPAFAPYKVHLVRKQPENITAYKKVFAAPIQFSAPQNALFFHRDLLQQPVFSANEGLAYDSEKKALQYLARIEKQSTANLVYQRLQQCFPRRLISQEIMAHDLNLSLRSLQRRLEAQGTSYAAILLNVKKEIALQLLQEESISLLEIARYLGFSSSSNFSRAFKAWSGVSPSVYRNR